MSDTRLRRLRVPQTKLGCASPDLAAQSPIRATGDLRKHILQSCHATLIRLGDLSRYRETELVSQDRNWGPAIGYYDLATIIYPASGASHNQLAVIALADGNHLKATYHLYRALAAQEPHPSAKGNLEIEFRKVMSAWAKRELIRPEDAGIPGRSLGPWFVYLHAQCYKGADFPEHDELESEVLNQLAVDVKERSLETTLQKFCLINIAAEDFTKTRSRGKPPDIVGLAHQLIETTEESVSNACLFFQQINVKTFFTLLQILSTEVERFAVEDPNGRDARVGADRVTVVARRILPVLRHYSSWLLTVRDSLVAYKEKDTPLSVQITEFWKIYANTLTLLASTFDVVSLPEVDYLLEEDEETLGFAPLIKSVTSRRYLDRNGQQKRRMHDVGVERSHPNIEMLYRIREFVIDGLDLVVNNVRAAAKFYGLANSVQTIPVALVDDNDKRTFIYNEEGLPSQIFSSPHGHRHTLSSTSVEREDIQQATQDSSNAADNRSVFGGSRSAASMSANMHRIVEGVERLVESDTFETAPSMPEYLSYPKTSGGVPAPPGYPFDLTDAAPSEENRGNPIAPPGLAPPMPMNSTVRASPSQSYTPRPSLPGIPSIWNTAVSPQVGDTSSPRTPPGLSQPRTVPGNVNSAPSGYPSQEQTANDLLFRQSLLNQSQFQNALDESASSPWVSSFDPSSSTSYNPPGAVGWGRDEMNGVSSPFGGRDPSQPMSSGLANTSWANNAFLASSLPSGAGYPSFGGSTDNRRSGAQLGAIGQTPPCGQGG